MGMGMHLTAGERGASAWLACKCPHAKDMGVDTYLIVDGEDRVRMVDQLSRRKGGVVWRSNDIVVGRWKDGRGKAQLLRILVV